MKIRFFMDVEVKDDMKAAMMLHIDLQAAVADVVLEQHLKTDGLKAVRLDGEKNQDV